MVVNKQENPRTSGTRRSAKVGTFANANSGMLPNTFENLECQSAQGDPRQVAQGSVPKWGTFAKMNSAIIKYQINSKI